MICSINCRTKNAGGEVPAANSPAGIRSYRQRLGLEGIHVHDSVAMTSVIHPALFTLKPMAGDVETMGELTAGMTVFDRRHVPDMAANMEVATGLTGASDRADHPRVESHGVSQRAGTSSFPAV